MYHILLLTCRPNAITVKTHSNNAYTDNANNYTRMVTESTSEEVITKINGTSTPGNNTISRFRPIETDGACAIKVQNIPNGNIGRPVEFEIDGSKAGSGNLEILVNGGRVTSSVRSLGGQRFIASFTPHEPGTHTVQITFNGKTIQGEYI